MEWQIEALDTLFFRGPDPFNAGESVALQSMFPPTPRTMQGFVRTALLEAHCVDIPLFAANGCGHCAVEARCTVKDVVGSPATGLGTLRLSGPYLIVTLEPNEASLYRGQKALSGSTTSGVQVQPRTVRLYRAPADLRQDERGPRFRLWPGQATPCDLGNVRLPWDRAGGIDLGQPLDWITEVGLQTYLNGQMPSGVELISQSELVDAEPRVGLARDAGRHAAAEHMLYQIEPLRLRPGTRIGLTIEAAPDDLLPGAIGLHRLGGEGRLSSVSVRASGEILAPDPNLAASIDDSQRFLIVLLQPADFDGSWLPPGFRQQEGNGVTLWRGEIEGVRLRIVSSCSRPPVDIGGWALAGGRNGAGGPAELRRCVEAGTNYYCELDQTLSGNDVVSRLHRAHIGRDTAMGFGQIVVGAWPKPSEGEAE